MSHLSKRCRRVLGSAALLCLLAYLPPLLGLLFGAWPFADDAIGAMRVWRELARQSLYHGQLPLWNPHLFCGMSFIGTGQSGVFYLPNLVYWILPVRVALLVDAIGHNILLFVGTYCLGRALRLSRTASWVAALSFGFSGAVAGHIYAGHVNWHAARAYLPWELWALLCYLRSGRPRYAYALALCLACQVLSGYPPLVLLSTGLCAGLLLARSVTVWSRQRHFQPAITGSPVVQATSQTIPAPTPKLVSILPRGWPSLIFAVLGLTVLLAAVDLLPLREMSRLSVHGSGLSYHEAVELSGTWRSFVRLALPDFFGGNQPLEWSTLINPHEEAAYAGLLPFILALGAPFFARRRLSEQSSIATLPSAAPWLWALMGLASVLALGDNTPIYHWLFDHISLFRMTRIPVRWLEVWCLAASLLAAFSFDACLHHSQDNAVNGQASAPVGSRLLLGVFGGTALGFLLLAAWLLLTPASAPFWDAPARLLVRNVPHSAHITATDIAATFRQMAVMAALTAGLLASLLAAFYHRWRNTPNIAGRRRVERLIILVLVVDMMLVFWRSARLVPAPDLASTFDWPPALTHLYRPDQRWATNVNWVAVNSGLPLGIDLFNGYDPMSQSRYFQFAQALEGREFWNGVYQPQHQGLLLRVAGTSHWLTDSDVTPILNWPDTNNNPKLVARAANFSLWQYPQPWPRLYLSRQVVRLPEAAQLSRLNALAARPYTAQNQPVVVAPGRFNAVPPMLLSQQDVVMHWQRDLNEMQVATRTVAPAVLVQSEAWYPGWHGWVNGRAVPIEQANWLFRAVAVPAGQAQVRVVYEPAAYRFGLFLSLWGLAALAALGVGRRVSQRVDRMTEPRQ